MTCEREKKVEQQNALFENYLAQEALSLGKIDEYKKYITALGYKLQNGMYADEIDAVMKRAKDTANDL